MRAVARETQTESDSLKEIYRQRDSLREIYTDRDSLREIQTERERDIEGERKLTHCILQEQRERLIDVW